MRLMTGRRTITALTLLILLTVVVAVRVRNGEAAVLRDGTKKGPNPIRVLLVTGGHLHDLEFYSLFNRPELRQSELGRPELRVTVDPHPAAFTGDIRQRYDVVVLYDMVRSLDEQRQQNLRDFVESGKGVVALHHAICANVDWKWWVEEVIGGRYLFEPVGGRQSSYIHDRRQKISVVMEHEVTRGIGNFQIVDETYKNLWISPRVKVLLRSDDPTGDGPVAWIGPHQSSRVVYIQLGHDRQAYLNLRYQQLVQQAIRWTAGR